MPGAQARGSRAASGLFLQSWQGESSAEVPYGQNVRSAGLARMPSCWSRSNSRSPRARPPGGCFDVAHRWQRVPRRRSAAACTRARSPSRCSTPSDVRLLAGIRTVVRDPDKNRTDPPRAGATNPAGIGADDAVKTALERQVVVAARDAIGRHGGRCGDGATRSQRWNAACCVPAP